MADAALQFRNAGVLPAAVPSDIGLRAPVSHQLANVAASFIDLQEQRYRADYDVLASPAIVTSSWAEQSVLKAEQAFRDWQAEKNSEGAAVFLTALILGSRWSRKA